MNEKSRISWKRLVVEGLAIVVSILLAFSIDAWWDDLQDREDEAVILTTLLAEFRDIAGSIDEINDYHVAILKSAYRLAEVRESDPESLDETELTALLDDMLWASAPEDFAASRLNGVITRGDFSLISNHELREVLLGFPEKFSWIQGVLNDDLDFSKNVLEPYLVRHISYLHVMHDGTERPGSSGFQFPSLTFTPRDDFSHADVVRSREFQNVILHRTILLEDIVSLARTPDLEQQVDDVIQMIEQELR